MDKIKLIGIIGMVLLIVISIIIKVSGGNPVLVMPFFLPFAAMILISLSRKKEK
jgi:hypothetical protein